MNLTWKPGDVAMVRTRAMIEADKPPVRALRTLGGWRSEVDGWARDKEVLEVRPLVVLDPEDLEQVERLDDLLLETLDDATAQVDMQAALRALMKPRQEVFEHFVLTAGIHGKQRTSICGKVWTPSNDSVSMGPCPECSAVVNAGWTK